MKLRHSASLVFVSLASMVSAASALAGDGEEAAVHAAAERSVLAAATSGARSTFVPHATTFDRAAGIAIVEGTHHEVVALPRVDEHTPPTWETVTERRLRLRREHGAWVLVDDVRTSATEGAVPSSSAEDLLPADVEPLQF